MAQRKIELFVGLALIVGVASYGWLYHYKNDATVTASLTDTVLTEITTLSGLKVDQSDFTPASAAETYTHLAINGETWLTQSPDGFDAPQTLIELPDVEIDPEAWYSIDNLSSLFNLSDTWNDITTYVKSYFQESE